MIGLAGFTLLGRVPFVGRQTEHGSAELLAMRLDGTRGRLGEVVDDDHTSRVFRKRVAHGCFCAHRPDHKDCSRCCRFPFYCSSLNSSMLVMSQSQPGASSSADAGRTGHSVSSSIAVSAAITSGGASTVALSDSCFGRREETRNRLTLPIVRRRAAFLSSCGGVAQWL